VFSSH
jgi:hypothetical protein